ncbi:MAG: amino acid adenylation domain-containing protein, partial [Planctomycetota bacterium]
MACQFDNLTKSQSQIWTGQRLHPDKPIYNMGLVYLIQGNLDPQNFCRAFDATVLRSDALRTVIEIKEESPKQVVKSTIPKSCDYLDFSQQEMSEAEFQGWVEERVARPFNLEECSYESILIKLTENQWAWLFNQHHILGDASSFSLIFDAVQNEYQRILKGEVSSPEERPSFQEFREFEKAQVLQSDLSTNWFDTKTSNSPPSLYGNRKSPRTTDSQRLTWNLGPELSSKIRELAIHPDFRALTRHMSQFNFFATVLFAYLSHVSGQRELTIGAPAHNRVSKAFKKTIGMFIELFPMAISIDSGDSFKSLFDKVAAEAMGWVRHAKPGASESHFQRSFNSVLNYITADFGRFTDIPMQSRWIHSGHSDLGHHFRIQVQDFDQSGNFALHFDFNNEVFDRTLKQKAIQHFKNLLHAFLRDPHVLLDSVCVLSDRELDDYFGRLCRWDSKQEQSLIQKFERQVADHPESIAISFGRQELTYRQLNQNVNRLVKMLNERGVRSGSFVPLVMNRSPEAIVAIIAIMKLGAAFVPLDPHSPAQRLRIQLEDLSPVCVLVQEEDSTRIPNNFRALEISLLSDEIRLSDPRRRQFDQISGSVQQTLDEGLAYMIFTSGSTGKPKGVRISQTALLHYLQWAQGEYCGDKAKSMPLFTPLSVDLSITSLFLPLLSGGTVFIYGRKFEKADLAIVDVVNDDRVDIIKMTPSHLEVLNGLNFKNKKTGQLILGGENLPVAVAQSAQRLFGKDIVIYNEYGPTEATVGCIVEVFNSNSHTSGDVPIGKPIERMHAFIGNSAGVPVPTGVTGELFLSGYGLADGYYRRPELTRQRFVDHPYFKGQKTYRTGDLARLRKDGVFEFLGRNDNQVKVNGVRIELGEIEAALKSHPQVQQVVLGVDKTGVPAALDSADKIRNCRRCGLPSNFPDISFDRTNLCSLCYSFDNFKKNAENYFQSLAKLRSILDDGIRESSSFDMLVLLSGGKDSTYMLSRLVEMGYRILAFTLDNGFISEEAKANIDRIVSHLGVEHVYGTTKAMNEIFVDSLRRHSNVCHGCFKTIYTLSLKIAREKNIPFIVTGLSRGQFFETRLTEELFCGASSELIQIDDAVLAARKQYHRVEDAVKRNLDLGLFDDDSIFEEVKFIDFYRYCDSTLEEMYIHLNEKLPWVRPSDTGRSTNCLINDAGIYVHKKERGFHNYAYPYSWDVRLGHKKRNEALEELDDEIDLSRVQAILDEIGYRPQDRNSPELVAYYVANRNIPDTEIAEFLSELLPSGMIPRKCIAVPEIPLNNTGKVDFHELKKMAGRSGSQSTTRIFQAPRTAAEKGMASIWEKVLRTPRIGIHDNFFDLGGDSIAAIQVIAKAGEFGWGLTPVDLFENLSVAELAKVLTSQELSASQNPVVGSVELLPIQQQFLAKQTDPENSSQVVKLRLGFQPEKLILQKALGSVFYHHDMLRTKFQYSQTDQHCDWTATCPAPDLKLLNELPDVEVIDGSIQDGLTREQFVNSLIEDTNQRFDIRSGPLVKLFWVIDQDHQDELIFVIHHLVIDGASWPVLLADFEAAYKQHLATPDLSIDEVLFPAKSTPFSEWSRRTKLANDEDVFERKAKQTAIQEKKTGCEPFRWDYVLSGELSSAVLNSTSLTASRIHELLLAAVSLTIMDSFHVSQFSVDVESHGRHNCFEGLDVSRTIGWFTAIERLDIQAKFDLPEEGAGENFYQNYLRLFVETNRCKNPGNRETTPTTGCTSEENSEPAKFLFNYLGEFERLIPS